MAVGLDVELSAW